MEFTKHAIEDRENRLVFIAKYIGWGEPILIHKREKDNATETITSTGICMITAENKLITAYPINFARALAMYRAEGFGRMPDALICRIKKNDRIMAKHQYHE